jgi:hypothetical protein
MYPTMFCLLLNFCFKFGADAPVVIHPVLVVLLLLAYKFLGVAMLGNVILQLG